MNFDKAGLTNILLPLKDGRVSCGFPFQGQDFVHKRLDLNDLLDNPATSLVIRAGGDSLIERGIFDDSYLIYDRRLNQPRNGELVYVIINGEECVREVLYENNRLFLISRNPAYTHSKIEITEETDLRIKGTILWSITKQR